MVDVQVNKQIIVQVTGISGGPISTYEWKLDDIQQINNTSSLIIQPNTLTIGNHTINFRGQNYCGNWSSELIENINITEVINMAYIQTDTLAVNQGTVSMTVKLRRISTVTITVTDESNTPVASALVDIGGGITGTTDALGVVILTNVPFGNKTVTTSIA